MDGAVRALGASLGLSKESSSSTCELHGWRGHSFLGGDGKVGGVWGTAPSARRFTMVRVKPQPPS